jgi:hypothetical protein
MTSEAMETARLRAALWHAYAALTILAMHERAQGSQAELLESFIGTAKNELAYLKKEYGDLFDDQGNYCGND